ncbi:MAG: hypothetical protein Q9227_007374 [Pyrenula ochraceoflavens]
MEDGIKNSIPSAGNNVWAGEFDPLNDPEERRVLFAALDSFRQYRRNAHLNVTHRKRQNFYALPTSQWQFLAAAPFSILEVFDQVDDAIDVNAIIAKMIVEYGTQAFGLPLHPEPGSSVDWNGIARSDDIGKAQSTIRQLYRDWSADGDAERSACYGPVLSVLEEMFSNHDKNQVRVLVPGAGLGRLVYEVCRLGFDAEGNEISWHQLLTSSWILNHTARRHEFDLFPFALNFTNLASRKDQMRKVQIPDVHPSSSLAELANNGRAIGSMNMTAADFVAYYSAPPQAATFDAVVTVFFIDTAPNLIRYIEAVRNCLKETGVWINLGPLHWHFDSRTPPVDKAEEHSSTHEKSLDTMRREGGIDEPGNFELTDEEVIKLVESMGFQILRHSIDTHGVGYIQNPGSMLQDTFWPSHWVARKIFQAVKAAIFVFQPESFDLDAPSSSPSTSRNSRTNQHVSSGFCPTSDASQADEVEGLSRGRTIQSDDSQKPSRVLLFLAQGLGAELAASLVVCKGCIAQRAISCKCAEEADSSLTHPTLYWSKSDIGGGCIWGKAPFWIKVAIVLGTFQTGITGCSTPPKARPLAVGPAKHPRPSLTPKPLAPLAHPLRSPLQEGALFPLLPSALVSKPINDTSTPDPTLTPPPLSLSSSPLMDAMSSRLKNLGFGSKRKSSATSIQQSSHLTPTAVNGTSTPQQPSHNSSSTSLPMNQQQQLGRPPSYTYNAGARPTSPMPPAQHNIAVHPPTIETQPRYPGNPAMGTPQPPGYGGYPQHGAQHPLPHGGIAQYGRGPAVEVEGAGRSKAQLIVGIDFGTTFSGVAFAFATNTEAKEDIITEWPGAGNQTKQKIPTVLYYDQYQKVVGWGPDIADALAPTGYPKPGVQKVEWFKLQLMLSGNTYIDPINLPPLPPGKSEIDVAADYLFKLRQAMRSQLQKTLGEVFNREERNIRYFLTVPAIWNDAGKAATRAAAIQAGFLRDENDTRLTLITEPEAAAMFCSKTGLLNLKIHDAVLIVDCGGGTVDLIAYEVEEETPFTVAECTAGSGDSCGSTALNRNFSNVLRAKIRKMKLPDGSRTAGRVYAKCIMDFENRIKADFRNNGQKWAVDVGIEAEFPEAGIEEGYMTFTNEEILQCFEPVVNRILELVRNQIIAIQAQNRSLQNVLVVGGFGASEYLFQQIKLHVPPQFQSKVVRPMDSVAAIVKGAVTAGITERVITSRVARRHYLMATLQPFKEGHHPEQYRVPSLDGKDRCKYTRQIFVQKGERVKIGEPVKVSFFRQVAPGATLMYEDILYACDEDVCPEYTKDPRIKEVVTLTSDLSRKNLEKDFERMDTPQGTFYRVYFDIYLTLDGSEFNAELVCQGEVMGRCSARFR